MLNNQLFDFKFFELIKYSKIEIQRKKRIGLAMAYNEKISNDTPGDNITKNQNFSQLLKMKDEELIFNEKISLEMRSNLLLIRISRRLFYTVFSLSIVGFLIILGLSEIEKGDHITLPMVLFCGVLGGFVGIQRRLKDLTIRDLELLTSSNVYLYLSPLVGGVLAVVLYMIFVSGLLQGDLFPEFVSGPILDENGKPRELEDVGFLSILQQYAKSGHTGYAKLMFWCFVAGYSEKFVTDVIGRFEGNAVKTTKR